LKEVPIPKRNIIVVFTLIAVLAGGIFALRQLSAPLVGSPTSTPVDDQLAASAAEKSVSAFFSVDYQEGMQSWLNRLCKLTTTSGCQFISLGATPLWNHFLDEKTIVQADADAIKKVAETESEQIWQVKITLSSALPGSNKLEDTAFVAMTKTDTGWFLDRFLFQPEIESLLVKQSQATQYGRNY
jgi:hypothetical protein